MSLGNYIKNTISSLGHKVITLNARKKIVLDKACLDCKFYERFLKGSLREITFLLFREDE